MLLAAYGDRINRLRINMLLGDDDSNDKTMEPFAEQHYLASLAALETAERHMKLARLHQEHQTSEASPM